MFDLTHSYSYLRWQFYGCAANESEKAKDAHLGNQRIRNLAMLIKFIRSRCKAKGHTRIMVVIGDSPPATFGKRAHWIPYKYKTKENEERATKKRGGNPRMVYVPSNFRIEVGIQWLQENTLEQYNDEVVRITNELMLGVQSAK